MVFGYIQDYFVEAYQKWFLVGEESAGDSAGKVLYVNYVGQANVEAAHRTIEASALPRYFFKIKKTKKTKHNIVSFNSSSITAGKGIAAGTQVFLHHCWYSSLPSSLLVLKSSSIAAGTQRNCAAYSLELTSKPENSWQRRSSVGVGCDMLQ